MEDKEMEIIVGKKYTNGNGLVVTVIYISPRGQIIYEHDCGLGIKAEGHSNVSDVKFKWREYVPPPKPKVKKHGWILLVKNKRTGIVYIPSAHPKETSALAELEFSHLCEKKEHWTIRIEWEEEVKEE